MNLNDIQHKARKTTNMKTLSYLILLLSCCNISFSQININGNVIDAETKQAIPYVNIGIKSLAIGTVSDDNGKYQLKVKDTENLITFSAIGYAVKNISGDQLVKSSDIELSPINYQIEAIEVVAQKLEGEDQIFGVKNKNRSLSIGFGSRQLGAEIGALIQIKRPTFIKNANFVLNHAKGDSLLFRVNIYDYQEGEVGEKILKENVFVNVKQKKGVISVDLTSFNLILNQDVLLTLEWIKDDAGKGNTGITFDTKKSKKLRGVHVKRTSLAAFKKMGYINSKRKPCFYFIGKQLIKK